MMKTANVNPAGPQPLADDELGSVAGGCGYGKYKRERRTTGYRRTTGWRKSSHCGRRSRYSRHSRS